MHFFLKMNKGKEREWRNKTASQQAGLKVKSDGREHKKQEGAPTGYDS